MSFRIVRFTIVAAVAAILPIASAAAQRAVTVSGHVTSRGLPLAGAHVRVDALGIDRTTDADGRYSFVVPATSVQGQTVTIVASMSDRRIRYAPVAVAVVLSGVPLVQDFDLVLAAGSEAFVAQDSAKHQAVELARPTTAAAPGAIEVDDAGGFGSLASVLVGRVAGLQVTPPSTPGGSSRLVFRGSRSALGADQPLVVVDGMPVSNTAFTSLAQRLGLGGFDYGTAAEDIDLANVESVRFISGAEASARYGGRGANGVVLVTTRSGATGPHFGIGATYVSTGGSYRRLPELQNAYGQGLDGEFSFFDGKGGGVKDDVAQNWGPALDGRPLAQASYAEGGRPDVRLWLPKPNNVQDYFADGSTSNKTATVQARGDLGSFHALVADRTTTGVTPADHLARRDAALQLALHPTGSRFEATLSAFGTETKHDDAPGTGVLQANPVFQFLRMGRQVDVNVLEKRLRDATGKQISWNYSGYNNPFFESLVGDNYSHRYHTAAVGGLSYALTSSLTASARAGLDSYRDGRLVTIPTGWMGGFPFYAAGGDFSRGGSQGDEISVNQRSAAFRLDNTKQLSNGTRWTLGAGVDVQSNETKLRSAGVDSILNVPAAGAPDTAHVPQPAVWSATASTNSVVGETGLAFANGASLSAAVRNAWITTAPSQTATVLLPSVRGSLDLRRGLFKESEAVTSASLRGSWWMDAPETNPFVVQSRYVGRTPSGAIAPVGAGALGTSASLSPETTNGFEVGTDLGLRRLGLGLGLTYYHEQTSDLILPVSASGTAVLSNAGSITNQGIEARLSAQLGDPQDFGWTIAANAAKNSNQVNTLAGGLSSLALGPSQFGVSIEARPGQPLGVIRGYRLQRNSGGALLLRNGLPVADSASGPQQLGVGQPSWSFGLSNTLRYRWFSISAQADARIGGQVFSATNMVGTYTGTLATTAFRPDSGLLIAGVDAVSGQANTQHVSAQDYYHALGSVAEPWVYSASFVKLREARISATLPLGFGSLPFESVRASIVGRNLGLWAKAPNIDPEGVFSVYQLRGFEMGQLPMTKSVGFELTIVP